MRFSHDELVLINETLIYFQKSSKKDCIQENISIEQGRLILLNQLLDKMEIELSEEVENNNICDDCHCHVCENGDIFIDSNSFKVDRSMVVCGDCYVNKYKDLYKDK